MEFFYRSTIIKMNSIFQLVHTKVEACFSCGSKNLIWDYKNGFIVCTECGVVQEKIIINQTYTPNDQAIDGKNGYWNFIRKKEKTYKKYMELHRKLHKLKRKLEIDEKAFLNSMNMHSQIKTLTSERTKTAIQNAMVDEKIRLIIEKVISKIPRLNSRTERGKIAAAMILAILWQNKRIDAKAIKILSEKTGTSPCHVKRIYKTIMKLELHRKNPIKLTLNKD